MTKKNLEKKAIRQTFCPNLGSRKSYGMIEKSTAEGSIEILEMRLPDFIKSNAGRTTEKIRPCYFRYMNAGIYKKRLSEVYGPNGTKMSLSETNKPHVKVKDLYTLTKTEIYRLPGAGAKTWRMINEMLELNSLPPVKVPDKYT